MRVFNKESLENLRQQVDLLDVLSTYVQFKRTGSTYKALCPFHDEKTPSFLIQKGDRHYHCFGCGAHGDAIQFLMSHQKMSFSEAVQSLASRFQVHLQEIEEKEEVGPNKKLLKEVLSDACGFFHFYLLHSLEGRNALSYLYQRGIDLNFIRYFQIGLSPHNPTVLCKVLKEKGRAENLLIQSGLAIKTKEGRIKDFFSERIMFPIHQSNGDIIGFSGRKYRENSFGGKYVNTSETALFKKSKVLFGLNYSRQRIIKERRVIIVEGQIDTLRLIQEGFNFVVSAQGTAFGDAHVKELAQLEINQVFLCLDSDQAGKEAAIKIGHLFQKIGIEVRVITLPPGEDPDSYLAKKGSAAFLNLLQENFDYLTYLVNFLSQNLDLTSPSKKNELIQKVIKLIKEWDHPIMIHEASRRLAHMLNVPEEFIGIGRQETPNIYIKKSAGIGASIIDPDRVLETDLLRWLLLGQEREHLVQLVKNNLTTEDFHIPICRKIYEVYQKNEADQKSCDVLSLAIDLNDAEAQLVLSDLLQKKINKDRSEELLIETIQKILDRNWMEKREEIKIRIQNSQCTEEQIVVLVKQFDELKRNPPKVRIQNQSQN